MTDLARAEQLFRELQHAEGGHRQELTFAVAAAINAVTSGLTQLEAPRWLVEQLHTRASLRLAGALNSVGQTPAATGSWWDHAMSEALLSGDATNVATLARYATESPGLAEQSSQISA